MTHPLHESWKRARANLETVDADPYATPTEVITAEAEFMVLTFECEREIADMERMETMQALTVTRLRALDSMAEAGKIFADMPILLAGVINQITENAALESELVFAAWAPGPGEGVN